MISSSIGTRLLVITSVIIMVLVGSFCAVTAQALEREAVDTLVLKARAISNEAENARQYVAALRGKHRAFDDERLLADVQSVLKGATTPAEILTRARTTPFYASIPIVAAWTVAQTNAEAAGYRFKVPKIQPRNPDNAPDSVERGMLEELASTKASELYRIDPATNSLRYMKPVVLTAECMVCHGSPEHSATGNGKDPLGFAMEGWKEGEVHGGFEVIADLGPVQARTHATLAKLLILAGLFLLGAIGGLIYATRRLVTRPLARAVTALEQVATGDLTPRLEVIGNDEVARLSRSLNAALVGIEATLSGVKLSANEMATASSELSAAAQHLSDNAQEQAATMERTNETLASISSGTTPAANDARQTAALAVAAHDRAAEGGQVVGSALTSVNEARDASKQIVQIVETIDDIAAQTNLLALNATVEAARAGDHGRGFAVVGGEVRELSVQSAAAAKRIHHLIDDTVRKAETGATFALRSREALGDIVGRVRELTDVVKNIAGAAQTQAASVADVHQAMGSLDRLVQGTASQTEELAATAENLNASADRLHELVARFVLTEQHSQGFVPLVSAGPSKPALRQPRLKPSRVTAAQKGPAPRRSL